MSYLHKKQEDENKMQLGISQEIILSQPGSHQNIFEQDENFLVMQSEEQKEDRHRNQQFTLESTLFQSGRLEFISQVSQISDQSQDILHFNPLNSEYSLNSGQQNDFLALLGLGSTSHSFQALQEPSSEQKEPATEKNSSKKIFPSDDSNYILTQANLKGPKKNNNKSKKLYNDFFRSFSFKSQILANLDEATKQVVISKVQREMTRSKRNRKNNRNANNDLQSLERVFGLGGKRALDYSVSHAIRKMLNSMIQDHLLFDVLHSHNIERRNLRQYVMMYKMEKLRSRSPYLVTRLQNK